MTSKTNIPKELQATLWSVDINQLDIDRDKNYIIHQIFSYGTLDEIQWLLHTYPHQTIQEIFTHVPYKDYRPQRFNLIKNYLLGLDRYNLDERLYVKNIPRRLG